MKKVSFLLIILMTIVSGYAFYNYRSSMIYSLEGSYQAEILNTREEEIGIYTINFQDDKVGLFSAYFDESSTGTIRNIEDNHYELVFDEFKTECTVLTKDEIQLNIYEEDYIFNRKSDVLIWERDYTF
ncbi:hypothetical protein GCM10008932_20300 [Alkalibacterium iburiense]|uniref:Uncharacterized protein n=1 Tax=Alkalibacterium iburiense TaxID=290589 RepID=A0ABP3HF41_9LACT